MEHKLLRLIYWFSDDTIELFFMKIIYTGLKYNYYDPKRGISFEHENIYSSLKVYPGAEVIYMPFGG